MPVRCRAVHERSHARVATVGERQGRCVADPAVEPPVSFRLPAWRAGRCLQPKARRRTQRVVDRRERCRRTRIWRRDGESHVRHCLEWIAGVRRGHRRQQLDEAQGSRRIAQLCSRRAARPHCRTCGCDAEHGTRWMQSGLRRLTIIHSTSGPPGSMGTSPNRTSRTCRSRPGMTATALCSSRVRRRWWLTCGCPSSANSQPHRPRESRRLLGSVARFRYSSREHWHRAGPLSGRNIQATLHYGTMDTVEQVAHSGAAAVRLTPSASPNLRGPALVANSMFSFRSSMHDAAMQKSR